MGASARTINAGLSATIRDDAAKTQEMRMLFMKTPFKIELRRQN
jgi:hypothetical protein